MVRRAELTNLLQSTKQQTGSKEANSKFKDMIHTLGQGSKTNSKDAVREDKSKEAKSKEAKSKDAVKEDKSKEATGKDATGKDAVKEDKSKEATGKDAVKEDKSKDATGMEAVKEDKSKEAKGMEAVLTDNSKEANSKKETEPAIIHQELVASYAAQRQNGQFKEEDTKVISKEAKGKEASSKEAKIGDLDLKKQLDNAMLLKPSIKNQEVEPKLSAKDLEQELKLQSGKDVQVDFKKALNQEGSADKIINPEMVPVETKSTQAVKPELIHIKVSDGAEVGPKVIEELKEKIQIVQTGERVYELELDPKNLGKIFVKVSFGKGETALEMQFSSKKTMEQMAKHMEQLGESIAGPKGNAVNIQVNHQENMDYMEQQEQQEQQRQQQQQRQREIDAEEFVNEMKQTIREQNLQEL